MLSCKIKIVKKKDDEWVEVLHDKSYALTQEYQKGAKTPKIGDTIEDVVVKGKSSNDKYIFLEV